MNGYVTNAIVSDVGADNFTIQRMPVIRTQEDEDRVRNNPRITLRDAAAVRKFSENVGAVAVSLSSDDIARLDSITPRPQDHSHPRTPTTDLAHDAPSW